MADERFVPVGGTYTEPAATAALLTVAAEPELATATMRQ
jgi:hypothetical protein